MSPKAQIIGDITNGKHGETRKRLPVGLAFLSVVLGAAVALTSGGLTTADAQAATPKALYVSQTGLDSGSCTAKKPCATLGYALTKASSGETIKISGTVIGTSTVSTSVTITTWVDGPAGSPGVLNGGMSGPVVSVASGDVTIDDLAIENGAYNTNVLAVDDYSSGSTVTISNSSIVGNPNSSGPAINNSGTMVITDSTISGNDNGVDNNHVLTILSSTISGNSGFGIMTTNTYATATIGATILADNAGGNCNPGGTTTYESVGYNLTNDATGTDCGFTASTDLVDKNPLLGPLANNGGPTQTLLPASTSPAADVIPKSTTLRGVAVCPGTDQRGVARPGQGETRCSIGAVEVGATTPSKTTVTLLPATVASGTNVAYVVTVAPTSGTGTPTGKVTFKIGTVILCKAALSGGVAACGSTSAPVGTDTVTGDYSGGGGFAKSAGTATLTVTS